MDNNILLPFWHNGPAPGAFYNFPGYQNNSSKNKQVQLINNELKFFGSEENDSARKHSQYPITTGTSVIGVAYDNGVIIAADTLLSYGKLARYENIDRVFRINSNTILGFGGDYADFQFLKRMIDQKVVDDYCHDDNIELKPKSLFNWLTRVMYNCRCRFNPLWVDLVVGGIQDGKPFLGHVDLRGRSYQDKTIGTGFGKHLSVPLLREYSEKPGNITYNDAVDVIKKSMEVLYYRDCVAYPKYKQVICNEDGAKIEGPFNTEQNWEISRISNID